MAQPRKTDTILVNELLAFVQNKLDVMDELSLEQICASSYTEAEIYAAKGVLTDTAETTVRVSARRKDGNGKKDLRDIFRVFKETDPDDVPTYVARDLYKLPPVTFDHVDVTRLLKDMQLLRADITDIKSKLEISERVSEELRNELASLRKTDIAVEATGRRSSVGMQADTPSTSTPRDTSDVSKNSTSVNVRADSAPRLARVTTTPSAPAPLPPPPPQPPYEKTRRHHRRPKPSAPPPVTDLRPSNLVSDKDGFILVEGRKRRLRRNRNIRGTFPAAQSLNLKAAAPTTLIYLSRLDVGTTIDDIRRHIRERRQGRIMEHNLIVKIDALESKRLNNFGSFRLQVPAEHRKVFLSPDFWPEGVVFRRYREAKRPLQSQRS